VTDDEAKLWLHEALSVSRETFEKLDAFRAMVVAENQQQNLISTASLDHIWARHIADSAQLLLLAGATHDGLWLDLGTGAGFPGLIIAILRDAPIIFVESRRKRIDFLVESASRLALSHVRVEGCRLETVETVPVKVISARAFAPLPRLFALAHRFSTEKTLWLLPKGQSATEELESVAGSWQGSFHVKPSVTDVQSNIIVAQSIRRVGKK
jgi:16S rRNA (guanine527-N7)-methyltransferase